MGGTRPAREDQLAGEVSYSLGRLKVLPGRAVILVGPDVMDSEARNGTGIGLERRVAQTPHLSLRI
jgi:hypothetical protein